MATFCDLPLEILLEIIERALNTSKTRHFRFCQMNDLSLVCKYLNRIMAPKLFRTYRLQLREKPEDTGPAGTGTGRTKTGHHGKRCFLTGTSLSTWNKNGFDARLEHLRKKAAFVRELRIVDHGQQVTIFGLGLRVGVGDEDNGPGPAPFDSALVPALLETLNALDGGVVSVAFEGTQTFLQTTRLPEEMWHWLSRIKPEKVSFDGYFVFPCSLERLPSVRFMSIFAGIEASRVLEVVRPAHLDIRVDTADRIGDYFREIFEPYPSLEQLDVRFRHYDDDLLPGYFDFTLHPETRVVIHMVVADIVAYIEAPHAWGETEEHLKEVFVDDFTKLDVRRDDGSDTIVISRPLPGQPGGVRELHIPEGDEDQGAVLVFEQAVLAALSESDPTRGLLDGPLENDDTAFWNSLDDVFATVYSQTFENLVRA